VRWGLDVSSYEGRVYPIGDTVFLIARGGGAVTAVDAASGEERWRRALPGDRFALLGPASASDPVYTVSSRASGTVITAVAPESGEIRWQHRFDGTLDLVGISGATLYLTSLDTSGQTTALVRFDSRAGASGTTVRIPLGLAVGDARVTVHGDAAYLIGFGGSLVAVDTKGKDARQRWRIETSVSQASAPAVSPDGRRLYISAGDGRLLGVNTQDGTMTGQTKPRLGTAASDRIVTSVPAPVVIGDLVVSAAPDGSLFSVNGRDPADWSP
jgi:outer membrane protein assembly factor BamB